MNKIKRNNILIAIGLSLIGISLISLGLVDEQANQSLFRVLASSQILGIPLMVFGIISNKRERSVNIDERSEHIRMKSFRNSFAAILMAIVALMIYHHLNNEPISTDLLIIIGVAAITKLSSVLYYNRVC